MSLTRGFYAGDRAWPHAHRPTDMRAANFELLNLTNDETLIVDSITADATLGAVTSLYGQDKSETHARKRLAILLAQRVVRRLQLYFLNQSQ